MTSNRSTPATRLHEEEEDDSLSSLFRKCQRHRDDPMTSPFVASSPIETERAYLEALETLNTRVRQSELFSSNEELDDIETSSIKYILVEYWLGSGLIRSTPTEMMQTIKPSDKSSSSSSPVSSSEAAKNRLARLERGIQLCEVFLARCRKLKVENKDDMPKTTAVVMASSSTTRQTPTSVREEKIARYNATKKMKEALSAIENAKAEDPDEDTIREMWTLRLRLSLFEAQEDAESGRREAQIMKFVAEAPPQELEDARQRRAELPQRSPNGPGIDVTHVGPDASQTRATFKDGVFRPYHNLPTMTVEEYGEIELRELKERTAREAAAPKPILSLNEVAEQGLEDDDDQMDAAVMKARKWEDWKDGVPKGSGVTRRF